MRPKWIVVFALAVVLASAAAQDLFSLRQHKVAAQFRSEGVTRTASFELPATPDRVFPLFGPVDEANWAEGWAIETLYSPQPEPAPGMVFTTQQRSGARLLWIVAELDAANHKIVYVTFLPNDSVGRLEITCRASSPSSTTVTVTQSRVGLSESGNHRAAQYTPEKHQAHLQSWRHAIAYYLKTGRRLAHHE
ncbi:MAG: hypothetical protein L0Z53_05600 [Acidobacteriales bacterium]|nr:hypothetical protein [Terriglobales bacterium]